MQEKSQLKIGSLLSYIQMALNIVIGLVYTPVMIRLLGKSEYGLYNTVSSTISMLTVLNLGFTSSYVRYYAKYKNEGREEDIYKLNGLFIIIFSIISVVAFACGLFLTFNLQYVFDKGLTQKEYEIARVLMLILSFNLALCFPMSVFSNIISAHEKFIVLKLLGMLKTVVGPLVTLPLLLMGFRSIAMVSVSLGVSVVTDLVYFVYVKCKLKQKFIFHSFEKGLFKSLLAYTSFIALNLIVDQINLNVDKFLLGRFKGTEAVAVYSIGFALYQYYIMFSSAISGVFASRTHRIVNETKEDPALQKQRLTELFVRVGRIQYLLLGLIATGLIFFGDTFIHFWVGEGYEQSYYVLLLLTVTGTIGLIQNCGIEIQRALNKHQFRSLVYFFMAIVNLILSIFLCQRYGAVGSAIGTAISFVLANGLAMNIYYHKACNVDIIVFWKNIFRISLGLILPVGVGVLLKLFLPLSTLWVWLVSVAGYVAVYAVSVWFISTNSEEKRLLLGPLRRILKK